MRASLLLFSTRGGQNKGFSSPLEGHGRLIPLSCRRHPPRVQPEVGQLGNLWSYLADQKGAKEATPMSQTDRKRRRSRNTPEAVEKQLFFLKQSRGFFVYRSIQGNLVLRCSDRVRVEPGGEDHPGGFALSTGFGWEAPRRSGLQED